MTKLFDQEEIDITANNILEQNLISHNDADIFKLGVKFAESKLTNKFPNGIKSYFRTFYEIVSRFNTNWNSDLLCYESDFLEDLSEAGNIVGFHEFAESLTDKFELINKDKKLNQREFFDNLNDFLNKELY